MSTSPAAIEEFCDPVHHDYGTTPGEGRRMFEKYLAATIKHAGSDLIVKVDLPPRVRVRGSLKSLQTELCTPDLMFQIAKDILDETQYKHFRHHGQIDFAYDYDDDHRFRVNLFMARGKPSLACRLITSNIMPFEKLYLPEILGSIALSAQGLILFAGVTGSGKSTSIASMLQYINERKRVHIVTIEDPIEYLHPHKGCIVNQREIGADTTSFKAALKYILRQDPDVVLIGELRDLETIEAALTVAETGHLAFATLHTNSAVQTINRIVDVFPPYQQSQIRQQLSFVLEAVMSQTLLPRANGPGRALALEVMVPNSAIRALMRDDKIHQIYSSMQMGQEKSGMQTMNQSLAGLVGKRLIDLETAKSRSPDIDELTRLIDQGPGANRAAGGRPAGRS